MFVFTIEDIIGLYFVSIFIVVLLVVKVDDMVSRRRSKKKLKKGDL
jgi:hypothetical protein